jgi:hypothetical protein
MRSALAALASAAVLIGAPSAGAAQRYAAPAGSGTACSQATPCSLEQAITKAATNDEVIVTTGTYSVAEPLFPVAATNVNIHGDTSAPMPKVAGTTGIGVPVGMTAGSRLSYMEITNSGTSSNTVVCNPGGLIERVRLLGSGEGATGLTMIGNCTARDSVVRVDGQASTAVSAYGYSPSTAMGTARNLTAIATGPQSAGIVARYTEPKPGSYTLDLKNSIASGEASDLVSRPNPDPEGLANIVVSNSNFDVTAPEGTGTIGGGSNQTEPPIFVDAANGDYHEAPGSPTIDAGVADQIGALDLEGSPRSLGAAPDIGAVEFVPPPVPVAEIESLSVNPKVFRAVKGGEAVMSRAKKPKAPLGATVRYALSSAGTVDFGVERALKGRRVGRKCAKQTRSNSDHKKCTRFIRRKGGFTDNGAAGQNRFKFSGRLGGKALKPGSYRLVASVGDSVKRARFKIVP